MESLLQVKLAAKTVEADGVVSFELVSANADPLPTFEPGAHIDLHVPGGPVRQYSLVNPFREGGSYNIGVLREPASRGGSSWLVDEARAGDILQISAPRNHFQLDPSAIDSLLLAGGIGITPLYCMAQVLARDQLAFRLHYCGRSLSRMAFVDPLRRAGYSGQVHIHVDEGSPGQQFKARGTIGAPSSGRHLYVCGPTGFMDHVLSTARSLGWDEEHLHREYFAAAPLDHASDGAFEVQLGIGGRVIRVAADQSAAHALLDAGVDISISCEQGVCGTCLTGVLEGLPEHHDMYLTDTERARNDCFTPCCSRARSGRLVLKL